VVRWFGFSGIDFFISFLDGYVRCRWGVSGVKMLLFFGTGKSLGTLFVSCHK
jgi:hypothetical protein